MQEPILEVIYGCMFSGKTEELIRRIHRLQFGSQLPDWTRSFLIIIPKTDSRKTRNIEKILKKRVRRLSDPSKVFEILEPEQKVVAFDEAQFFPQHLIEVVEKLVKKGRRVIVSGLNLDFRGKPWPTMVPIICGAEDSYLCVAVCARCGKNRAVRSQRLIKDGRIVLIGDKEAYEARCLSCFEPPTD